MELYPCKLRPFPTILLPKFFQWVESLLSCLLMCRQAIPWLLQEIVHADRFCCSSETLLWSNLNCICGLVVYWGLTLNHLVALCRYYSQKVVSWWKCGVEASPFSPQCGITIVGGRVPKVNPRIVPTQITPILQYFPIDKRKQYLIGIKHGLALSSCMALYMNNFILNAAVNRVQIWKSITCL